MGSKRYPEAEELLITADGGGSNGSRHRLWKVALQELAEQLGNPSGCATSLPGAASGKDRAPDVLPHKPELAGTAAGQP
jgi:hypothetical protein